MRGKTIIIAFILICLTSTAFSPALATPPQQSPPQPTQQTTNQKKNPIHTPQENNYEPGELIIAIQPDTPLTLTTSPTGTPKTGIPSLDTLNTRYHLNTIEKILDEPATPLLDNTYLLTYPSDTDILALADTYSANTHVAIAEPNYLYTPCHMPNDPYFPQQWALHNTGQTGGTPGADIHAPEAWDLEQGDPNITIAILDTGVDYTHPDLGNYTGLTEENYTIETPHPFNGTYSPKVTFPQYDSVSFHMKKFDLSSLTIENTINATILPKKLTLFASYKYNGSGAFMWSMFSENDERDINISSFSYNTENQTHWGLLIDKIRGIKWTSLGQQSTKFVDGYDYFYKNPDPMDTMGHGTHCAGIAAANTDNNIGIAGIAGGCRIMPIKGGGGLTMSLVGMMRGLIYATNHGANIVSMSFGGATNKILTLSTAYADTKGVVLIAAAGNSFENNKDYSSPASNNNVIAVAATDANDSKAYFTNYGSWVDVAAPGVDVLSLRAQGTDIEGNASFEPPNDTNATLCRLSGTSMACPLVAGVAGLILSKNPSLNPAQVRTILRSSTDPVNSSVYIGTGRINAYTALIKTAPVTAEFDHALDDKVGKGTIRLKGVAEGDQFVGYSVDYAYGVYPQDGWVNAASGTSPINGSLASVATAGLREGIYTFRLTVNASGNLYQDVLLMVINNKPNTFYVDAHNLAGPWDGTADHPFATIQCALEFCGKYGDKVSVASGVYHEYISIENRLIHQKKYVVKQFMYILEGKAVSIQGEDMHTTFLDGGGLLSGALSLVEARLWRLSGFTIRNYTSLGILCLFSQFNRFDHLIIEQNLSLAVAYGMGNMFYDNTFRGNLSVMSIGSIGLWYNPLTLHGNYWADYKIKHPDAARRVLAPWAYDTPYAVGITALISPFSRLRTNNDRFPLVNPP